MYAISPAPTNPKITNTKRTSPVGSRKRLASPAQTPAIHLLLWGERALTWPCRSRTRVEALQPCKARVVGESGTQQGGSRSTQPRSRAYDAPWL
jgi:hypothetical protein